ncbi:MAG TPA: sigma-70 family RNA polymerase sigma factor [Gemmatimonadales bacterium]|nr:sigma-70 family RNA polymerase sigma factor [Gemmatimonadales bacterium]
MSDTHEGGRIRTVEEFETQMLPYLDDAHNLARHLMRDDHDAQDVVQEAYLRALKYFRAFRGTHARAWLLAIVRHTAYTQRRRGRVAALTTEFSDELHSDTVAEQGPERDLDRRDAADRIHLALDELPTQFREVLVLREMRDLSYEEIARIVRAPVGTVMSRLSRARARLAQALTRATEVRE